MASMSTSLQHNTTSGTPQSSTTSIDDAEGWRARIRSSLKQRATPEQLTQAKTRRSERQQRHARLLKQAEQLHDVQSMSSAATYGCYASFGATPERAFNFGGSARARAAFGAAATAQTAEARLQRVTATMQASPMVERAARAVGTPVRRGAREEEQEEALTDELALTVGATEELMASAGHAWAVARPAGTEETSLTVGARAREAVESVTGDDAVLDALLAQLKVEPPTDEERAAKFAVYEAHAATLGTCRNALFNFWEGCRDEFPAAPTAATDRLLKELDAAEAAGMADHEFGGGGGGGGGFTPFQRREPPVWFAYFMARKATENEGRLNDALRQIRAKLEQLSTAQDCPCCLEPIVGTTAGAGEGAAAATAEGGTGSGGGSSGSSSSSGEAGGGCGGVTLGCAHQICAECYANWVATCERNHKPLFCPLCRNDEFVADLLDEEGV